MQSNYSSNQIEKIQHQSPISMHQAHIEDRNKMAVIKGKGRDTNRQKKNSEELRYS